MNKSHDTGEIFLQPGEVFFGGSGTRIRTVLGSCVAITMWHPKLLLGGMCHYMLPSKRTRHGKLHCRVSTGPIAFPSRRASAQKPLDGRYADEALELMIAEMRRNGVPVSEFEVKLFGGGNMFPAGCKPGAQHVGLKNVMAGSELLARHGFKISAEHVGGLGHRNLIFDVGSGDVWMRHQTPAHSPCDRCQGKESCLPH